MPMNLAQLQKDPWGSGCQQVAIRAGAQANNVPCKLTVAGSQTCDLLLKGGKDDVELLFAWFGLRELACRVEEIIWSLIFPRGLKLQGVIL